MSKIYGFGQREKLWARGWIFLGQKLKFFAEIALGRRSTSSGIYIALANQEEDVKIHFGIVTVLSIWFGMERILPGWLRRRIEHEYHGRETGIMLSGDFLSLRIWHSEGLYQPSGIFWSCFLLNKLLGRAEYSRRDIQTTKAYVWLPERPYPVHVTMHEDTWKRPRWPRPMKIMRASIECGQEGIPAHAGKGENSWDLDDDSVFSMTCRAETVRDAIEVLKGDIMRDRKRYGWPKLETAS